MKIYRIYYIDSNAARCGIPSEYFSNKKDAVKRKKELEKEAKSSADIIAPDEVKLIYLNDKKQIISELNFAGAAN